MLHRTTTALVLTAGTLALPLLAAPAASAQSGPNACAQALNPERRSVYRFTSGSRTLPFGRVVVTATKANRHRYCFQVRFDGRTVFHAFGQSGYERRDGRRVNVGGLGDSGYRTGSYTRSVQVPDRYRVDHTFSVRTGGRWYRTIAISRYNL